MHYRYFESEDKHQISTMMDEVEDMQKTDLMMYYNNDNVDIKMLITDETAKKKALQKICQTPGALISNGARQIFSLQSIHHLRPES